MTANSAASNPFDPSAPNPITSLPSSGQTGVVVASIVGNTFSPKLMINVSFGLFLIPMATDFGWPRDRVSGALTALALTSALTFPIAGRLADRFGARRLILLGLLCAGLAVLGLGLAPSEPVLFYGLFALIGLFGSLASTMMYNLLISGWFEKARGTMLGVTAGVGNGIGATGYPIVVAMLMGAFAWRGAFITLSILFLVIALPTLFFLLKERPLAVANRGTEAKESPGMTLAQASGTWAFWQVLVAICVGAGGMTALLSHTVPILSDRGLPIGQSVLVVSVFAMVGAGWMIATGWLLDRIATPKLVVPLYLVAAGGVLMLEYSTTLPALVAAGVMMGVGLGTEVAALSFFIARYFGLRRFGAISGVMYSAVTISSGITPYLMDVDFEHHRTYVLSLHIAQIALVAGALILLFLPAYRTVTALWRPIAVRT